MIKSFTCKHTKLLWESGNSKKIDPKVIRVALRKLWLLDNVAEIEDLKIPPGNRLESLIGDRKGQYSIRINNRWRICFFWHENNAYDVEIVDYH